MPFPLNLWFLTPSPAPLSSHSTLPRLFRRISLCMVLESRASPPPLSVTYPAPRTPFSLSAQMRIKTSTSINTPRPFSAHRPHPPNLFISPRRIGPLSLPRQRPSLKWPDNGGRFFPSAPMKKRLNEISPFVGHGDSLQRLWSCHAVPIQRLPRLGLSFFDMLSGHEEEF